MTEAALLPVTLGIVGLVVGSFLGLVSLRVPAGLDIVAGRSRCGSCGETLSPLRLIPVLSYVWSRGRCVDCGASIPARYPLLEITAAAIGVVAGLSQTGFLTAGLVATAGWHWLVSLTVYVEHRRVPAIFGGSLLVSTTIAAALVLTTSHKVPPRTETLRVGGGFAPTADITRMPESRRPTGRRR